MSRIATVACVGIATLDLVHTIDAIPTQPLKLRATSFTTSLGGMAAVAACAVQRLGGAADLWSPVGDDTFGDTIRRALVEAGVGTTLPPMADATSSHSAVLVDARGERLIVNHRGSGLARGADALGNGALRADAVLADVRWPAGAAELLDRAQAQGLPTVLDADTGEVEALRVLVPRARHVVFSEPGFAQWSGVAADSSSGRERLMDLARSTATLAAVTRGERGTMFATRDGVGVVPAFAVTTIETLGAGDVFHGAYALALAEGMALDRALRFASAAAAIRCTRRGGRAALPERHETEALLASAGSDA